MDRGGAKRMLEVLKTAYPASYKGMTAGEMTEAVDLYAALFSGHDEAVVAHAVKNYIKENVYPPTPAGVFEQIRYLEGEPAAAELWAALHGQLGKSLYEPGEAFAALPEPCRRWVGSPTALREIALLPADKVTAVIRGEFLKSIKPVVEAVKAKEGAPPKVREAIGSALKLMEEEHLW